MYHINQISSTDHMLHIEVSSDTEDTMFTHQLGMLGEIYLPFNFLLESNNINNSHNLTDTGREIVKRLIRIPGVINIDISNNLICLTKNPSFKWVEIKPFIEDFLNDNLHNFQTFSHENRFDNFINELANNYRIITNNFGNNELLVQFRVLLAQKGHILNVFETSPNASLSDLTRINEDTLKLMTRRGRKLLKYIKHSINIDSIDKITFLNYSLCVTFKPFHFRNEFRVLSDNIANYSIV